VGVVDKESSHVTLCLTGRLNRLDFNLYVCLSFVKAHSTAMEDKVEKIKPSHQTIEKAKYLLNRLSALTSTLTGLDGVLMLAQYSSPLIIALLLRLAKLKKDGGKNLLGLAGGIAAGAGGIGETRTVMRAFGMSLT
jgi:hypothetical protein